MALFRRLFYRKPPDRLLEITDRVYVFDCCFSTKTLEEEKFRTYIDEIILQLQDHFPDASFMVFNFRQGEGKSLISSLLSLRNITTKDYPHQFSGCPLLPLDTICKFLIMCEAWLTADSSSQNIMLMHCESGGWPLLAFMLASLLLYRKQYTGEQRTLEMVYKQGPKELLGLLSPLNPTSSHLRYLQYVGKLTSTLEKQPQIQNPFTLDCLILRAVPNFDGKGCRPIVRVYGIDSSGFVDKSSQMLFSTSKTKKYVKHYQKASNTPIKLNVGCRVEGDVVLECIHLDKNLEAQEVMFRVMFNTRFIQSHILVLTLDDIELAWESKDHFSKDFKAEVLFSEFHSESDTSGSDIEMDFAEEFFEAEEMLETPDLHDEHQRDPDPLFFDPYGRNTVEFATPRAETGSYFSFARSARKRASEETSCDDFGLIIGTPGEESFLHEAEQELEMVLPSVPDVSVVPVEINASLSALCKLITPQDPSPPPLLLFRPMLRPKLKETAGVTSLPEGNVVKQNTEHTSSPQLLAMEIPTILSQQLPVLNPPPPVPLSLYTHRHVPPFEGKTEGSLPTIPSPQPAICYKDHELLLSNREGASHPPPLDSTRSDAVHPFPPSSSQPIVEMISKLQTPSVKTKTTPPLPPMPLYTSQATAPASFSSPSHEDALSPSPPFPTGHGKIPPPTPPPPPRISNAPLTSSHLQLSPAECSGPPPPPPPPQIFNVTSTSSPFLLRTTVCSELSPLAPPPPPSQTSNAPSTSLPFLSLLEVCNGSLSSSPPKSLPPAPQISGDCSTSSPFLSYSEAFSRQPPPPPRTSNDSLISSPLLSSPLACSGTSLPPSPLPPTPPPLLKVSSDSSPGSCSGPLPPPPSPPPPPLPPPPPPPLPPLPPPPPRISSAPSTSSPLQPPSGECSRPSLPNPPQIPNNSISLSFKPFPVECSKPLPPPPPPLPFKSCGSSQPPTTCNEPPIATPPRENDRAQPSLSLSPMECNVPPLPPSPPPPPVGLSRPPPPLPPSPPPPPGGFSRPPLPPPPPPPPSPGGNTGAPSPPPPPRAPPPPPFLRGHGGAPPPPPPLGGHKGAPPPPPPPLRAPTSGAPPPPPFSGGHGGAPPPPPPPGGHTGAPPPPPPGALTSGAPPPPPFPRGHGGAPPPPAPPGWHKPGIPGPPMAPGAPPPPPRGANPQASLKGFPGNLVSGRGLGIGRSASSIKKSSLKPLHWNKVTRIMNGTLWAELQRQSSELQIQEDFDVNELEQLFSAVVRKPNDGSKSEKQKSAGSKNDKVHLIDLRRANNTEIMLTKIKMPLPDMMNAILAMDDSILDGDQVENLLKFCPTKEEMETLKNFAGDKETLGKCEQYFLELMKVPRVESKLRVFSFKIQFISQMSDVKKSLQLVRAACDEIRNSEKLKEIMKKILNLGNTMNQGTARGSAVGFRLDSLLKLADTRGKDSKVTLMHYLCKVTAAKWPHLMDFQEELVSLEVASKIQLKVVTEEQEAVSKGLKRAENELKASKEDGPVSEIFRQTLEEFVTKSQADVEHMKALYAAVDQSAKDLSVYFGEDPAKCPFEQVIGTILNFMRLFRKAHEENLKYAEMEKKKAQKDAELEKSKDEKPTAR